MPINIQNNMPVQVTDIPRPVSAESLFARAAARYETIPHDRKLKKVVDKHFLQISPGHYIERAHARPDGLVHYGARSHPRKFLYPAPARTRILAHLLENPRWIADSWSAAALFGLTFFVDSADTFVVSGGDSHLAATPVHPTRRRTRVVAPTWTLHAYDRQFYTVPPVEALVQCLISVAKHTHWWHCAEVAHLSPETVRSVQVIDHFRRELAITPEQIARQAKRCFNRATLSRLLRLSDDGADSPQETVLRLIVTKIAKEHGLTLESQVELLDGDRLLTTFDLAASTIKLGFMYDGGHHQRPDQHNKDMWITAIAQLHGWTVLRMNAEMLESPTRLVEFIDAAIRRATSTLNEA